MKSLEAHTARIGLSRSRTQQFDADEMQSFVIRTQTPPPRRLRVIAFDLV
jgi:hypothetical protein